MFGTSKNKNADDAPLSLKRITTAFAAMLGRDVASSRKLPTSEAAPTPAAIVESLLFVGNKANKPLAADELAGAIRDMSAGEIAGIIDELNATYEQNHSAWVIEVSAAGYRMALREQYQPLRHKYLGRVKATTLSPPALEVLAVVAYRQPIDLATIDRLRESQSQALVSQLVRRGLVARDATQSKRSAATYRTTPQFLTLFGIDSIEQLPRAEEFDLPDLPPDKNDVESPASPSAAGG
jgi:segregation and condensation protein B